MPYNQLISVIIPAFNADIYIAQCIESILCQSYKFLEIIVVDDGSTDKTVEVVEQYDVKLIKQHNKGVSAARNRGIMEARGEYIHFMDADDYLNLHFYERLISSSIMTDADVACSGLFHERLPSLSRSFNELILLSNLEDKMLITNVVNEGYSVKFLIKKTLLDEFNHTFDETLSVGEDMVFTFKLIYWANRIVTVPDATYYYKNRPHSIMTSGGKVGKVNRKLIIKRTSKIRDEFARLNNIPIVSRPKFKDIKYKLFGFIPILTKRYFDTGRIRWYLLGVVILQQKAK